MVYLSTFIPLLLQSGSSLTLYGIGNYWHVKINFTKVNLIVINLKIILGVEETVQQLRTLNTLEEDQGSVPSTHLVANNHFQLQFQWI